MQQALLQRRHRVVEIDLRSYFDSLRQDRILSKLAQRVEDPRVLRRVKQVLRSAGRCGVPQGSPLCPLLANLALNELDHALERGKGTLTYVRYLDDMVVLAPDSERGRRGSERARERIREEAEALGVSLNTEKSRTVSMTETGSHFVFLGFVSAGRAARVRGTGLGAAPLRRREEPVGTGALRWTRVEVGDHCRRSGARS